MQVRYQAALRPDFYGYGRRHTAPIHMIPDGRDMRNAGRRQSSALQCLQQFLKFHAQLMHDLLAL